MMGLGSRIGVFGESGSGKSTYAKALARGLARVVIVDPQAEYDHFGPAFDNLGTVAERLEYLWPRTRFAIRYVPRAEREPECVHRLAKLLKRGAEQWPERTTLLIEELNLSYPVTGLPRKLGGLPELCSRGRHYAIDLIGVSQRPSEVATRFRGNLSEVVLFRFIDPRDVAVCRGYIGDRAGALPSFADHHFIRRRGTVIETGRNRLRAAA